MPRTSRPDAGGIHRFRATLAEHFKDSPLVPIAQQIGSQLDILERVSEWEVLDQESRQEFLRQCENLLHVIPATAQIGPRFWFDINMIGAIAAEWATQQRLLSSSIVPRASSQWQYAGIHIPNFTPERMPRIDVIDFPGSNNPEGINLLAYPWLYHELGHPLLAQHGASFVAAANVLLDEVCRRRSKQRLGKAPAVQRRSREIQKRIERVWRPSPNHSDWSHEIAADIVALWSCGPAFLAAYDDSLDGKKPHIIDEVHPPYEIRSIAIAEAARRLGWEEYVSSLASRIDEWARPGTSERDDVFLALGGQELVGGVVTAGLDICSTLKLPRCDHAVLSHVNKLLADTQSPSFGRSLILASWLMYERCNEDAARYHGWESRLVGSLVQSVIP